MPRIVLLLLCLAALSQIICAANNKKKRGKGGSKKKGNKKNKGASKSNTDFKKKVEGSSGSHSADVLTLSDDAAYERKLTTSDVMKLEVDESTYYTRGFPSQSNIQIYRATRMVLDLRVDVKNVGPSPRSFRLKGSVDIYYEKQDRGSEESLVLDSWGLKIKQAEVSYDGGITFAELDFVDYYQESGEPALYLMVDPDKDGGILRINYIAPGTESLKYTSLQYMPFSDLRNHPILAIFNQPSMARTWVPCQDTLLVKTPVEMRINVPSPMTALATGMRVSESSSENNDRNTFEFFQPMPVAAQQLTVTVGMFERWNISERIFVWMEPGRGIRDGLLMESESILKICESMVGPFVWRHLNIVIIPDKMGYKGEMLGPNTIYLPVSMFEATASPIQDDSLRVQQLTRQIFQSWYGNLVTASPNRVSRTNETLPDIIFSEWSMVAGIAEYFSYYATASFLDGDRHLADFFFYRAKDYASKVDLVFKPFFQEEIVGARRFSVVLRRIEDKVGLGSRELFFKFLRIIVLFSVVDDFSADEFWGLLYQLFPDADITEDYEMDFEPEGWSDRYWVECQKIFKFWSPLKGRAPVVKPGQLNQLNYAQVAHILEEVWREKIPLQTVRKISSVLKKMGIYDDANMFYRWALSALATGDKKIEEQALEYIKKYEKNPGTAAIRSLFTLIGGPRVAANQRKLKNIEKKIKASGYAPWN